MFDKVNSETKTATIENKGVVAKIKEQVNSILEAEPTLSVNELKEKVISALPSFNKATIMTQVNKILREKDKEQPFKKALTDLIKKGNLKITDTDKIEAMIDIYNSSMTIEEVTEFLTSKSAGKKSIALKDLVNYDIVEEETADSITLVFNNKTIFAHKA